MSAVENLKLSDCPGMGADLPPPSVRDTFPPDRKTGICMQLMPRSESQDSLAEEDSLDNSLCIECLKIRITSTTWTDERTVGYVHRIALDFTAI